MDYKEFSSKIKAKHPGAYDDLSDEDLAKKMIAKFPEYSDVTFDSASPQKGLLQRGWDALAVPEQKSREGLQMLAGMVPKPEPTGNLPLDIIKGTPRIAADTMAEAAPGFVSRLSLLTAGGAKVAGEMAPLAKTVLRSIGTQGEELSGIAPKAAGALEGAYKDPTLIFSKGKKAAGQFYEAAKDEANAAKDTYKATSMNGGGVVNMEKAPSVLANLYKPEQILDTANEFVKGGGKLDPAEALKVRKALDILLKSKQAVPDELYRMREEYDALAKASDNISSGDAAYQRGMKADALRNAFPQNKYGGASAFKLGIMTALENMGLPGKAALLAISPAAQGMAATGAGVMARQVLAPVVNHSSIAMALAAALSRRKEKSHAQ